jgi:hypothetical protein
MMWQSSFEICAILVPYGYKIIVGVILLEKLKHLKVQQILVVFVYSASEQDVSSKWHLVSHTRKWKRVDKLLDLQYRPRSPAKGLHQCLSVRRQHHFTYSCPDNFLHVQVTKFLSI